MSSRGHGPFCRHAQFSCAGSGRCRCYDPHPLARHTSGTDFRREHVLCYRVRVVGCHFLCVWFYFMCVSGDRGIDSRNSSGILEDSAKSSDSPSE